MKSCRHNVEYLAEERRQLRQAISEARKKLTSTRGREVGRKEAERYFLARGLDSFRGRFHRAYCGGCPERAGCRTARYWDRRLAGSRK